MRILHVTHVYYPSYGGNQMEAQGLSEALAALGEEVTVFTGNAVEPSQLFRPDRNYEPLAREEAVNGVTIRRFRPHYRLRRVFCRLAPLGIALSRRLGANRLADAVDMARARYPFVPQMLWAIRRHRPDIVMANNGFPATTLVCYLARRHFGIPLVIRTTTHVAEGWHKHPFQSQIYRAADCLIANTEFERQVLVTDLQIEARKIVTIGNALDPSPFDNADGDVFRSKYGLGASKVVAFVGRKVAGKGIDTLIDAMKIVWQRMPSARLIVAGQRDRVYSKPIDEKLAGLSLEQATRVVDIDDFTEEEKPQIYAACDVFAMPSNVDSFGLVYLEAWASAKPVVACRNTPQETLIDHEENGMLVGYGHAEELAGTLCRLLSDDDLRARLGRHGKERMTAAFTWDTTAPRFRDEYYRIVNEQRSAP